MDTRGRPTTGFEGMAAALDRAMTPPEERTPPPTATCPRDGEPLIPTFEMPGAEWHCLICGRWIPYLSPTPKPQSAALEARYRELRARYNAGERGPSE